MSSLKMISAHPCGREGQGAVNPEESAILVVNTTVPCYYCRSNVITSDPATPPGSSGVRTNALLPGAIETKPRL